MSDKNGMRMHAVFFAPWMSKHPQQADSPTKDLCLPRATTILDTDGIPWLQLALGVHMAQMPDRYRIPYAEGRSLPVFYTARLHGHPVPVSDARTCHAASDLEQDSQASGLYAVRGSWGCGSRTRRVMASSDDRDRPGLCRVTPDEAPVFQGLQMVMDGSCGF